MAAWADLAVEGGVMLISCYLWHGEGLTLRNLSLLDAIGELVKKYDIPWISAGDFQMPPDVIRGIEWLQAVKGTVIDSGVVTCSGTGGGSNIDFFVVDSRLVQAFTMAEVVVDPDVTPHQPVRITLKANARAPMLTRIWRPKAFSLERPVGCARKPEDGWTCIDVGARQEQEVLDEHWRGMCQRAEREVCGIIDLVGDEARPFCGRGEPVRTLQVSILGPKADDAPRGNAVSRAWKWLAARLGDMVMQARAARLAGRWAPEAAWQQRCLQTSLRAAMCRLRALGPQMQQLLMEALRSFEQYDLAALGHGNGPGPGGVAEKEAVRQARIVFCLQQYARRQASFIEQRLAKERAQRWRDTLKKGSAGCAGFIHRLSKWKQAWKPAIFVGTVNAVMVHPQQVADIEADKWCEIWAGATDSAGHQPRPWENERYVNAMVQLTTDSFTAVCVRFRKGTGIAVDWWHPRHWAWLSPEACRAFVALILYISRHLQWPSQVKLLNYFLTMKKDGGFRPLALMASLVRVVERIHAEVAEAWEKQYARTYDWAMSGRSAQDAVWQQMLHDEGKPLGQVSATVVLDMEKAFEHVSAYILWAWHQGVMFPMQLLHMMIEIYSWERVVVVGDAAATRRASTFTAIAAGSVFATRALKIITYTVVDQIRRRWENVIPRAYVDDIALQRIGADADVRRDL